MKQIIVIGGGAAGMMAALTAARAGACVVLLERNQKVGRKLYITGKGRCNLTNDCTASEVLQNVPGNPRFLTGCMTRFPPEKTKEFFTALGVPLKTERGSRVFPVSDRAADIVDALFLALKRTGVEIRTERALAILTREGKAVGVRTDRGTHHADAVILATGGLSYPLTGSTGDGYDMAAALGHTIVTPRGSLVPLETEGEDCREMQGLSLRNVAIKVKDSKSKVLFAEQGELLFTHFGVSGPLILSASAHLRDYEKEHYTLWIDLKPALDEKTLDARLVRELSANPNRAIHNVLEELVPRLMIPVMLRRAQIAADTPANSVTKQERRRLLELLKAFPISIRGPRDVAEAVVTAGGVRTGEVDPKTMASRKVAGLYFAGELLDVDAYTGGFNLQIAWATGHAAGQAAAASISEELEHNE